MSAISIDRNTAPRSAVRRAARIFVLTVTPVLTVLGFLYIYFFNPNTQNSLFFPCPVHSLTGLYCPGCGNTRALHALVHLDFLQMLSYNAIFPFLFVLLGWLLTGEYLNLLLGRRVLWLPKRAHPIILVIGCAAVFAFTILRNVPVYPFTLLAP